MPKRRKTALTPAQQTLYRDIRAVLESARSSAYRAVNVAMVQAYWQVGRLIVEHEQGGQKRATYGEAVLDARSERLTTDFGKGFTTTNLKYMRSFYLAFPIRHALRDESAEPARVNAPGSASDKAMKRNAARSKLPIRHALRDKSAATLAQHLPAVLRPELSWTHYRLLLGVEDHYQVAFALKSTSAKMGRCRTERGSMVSTPTPPLRSSSPWYGSALATHRT